MAEAVIMPQVGQDIETARIVEWFKHENDPIQKGDIIATVESDKATFDVEAYESGVLLKILYDEGVEVGVLSPIAYIGQPGEDLSIDETQVKTLTSVVSDVPFAVLEPVGRSGQKASPSARRLAREKGLDLRSMTGTGPGGRIIKKDVLEAVNHRMNKDLEEARPFSSMRARIAERLILSKQTIPHFTLFSDFDMTEALDWRRQFNEQHETRITVTDIVVKAAAFALKKHPGINAHVETDRVIFKKRVNVGVAVSVEDGLVVPVIADADTKMLTQIGEESRRNAEAIREGKMLSNAAGSFTVSNLGMYSVDMFIPIINPPECAILALGQASLKPVVVEGVIKIRSIMTVAMACDHRAVDGVVGARFLETIKQRLENPALFEESP